MTPTKVSSGRLICSVEGQQLRYVGLGVGFDDVIVKGNPAEMKVSVVHRVSHTFTNQVHACSS